MFNIKNKRIQKKNKRKIKRKNQQNTKLKTNKK